IVGGTICTRMRGSSPPGMSTSVTPASSILSFATMVVIIVLWLGSWSCLHSGFAEHPAPSATAASTATPRSRPTFMPASTPSSLGRGLLRHLERFLEQVAAAVDLLARDPERRRDPERVPVEPALPDQEPALARLLEDPGHGVLRRGLGLPVL